MVLSDLSSGLLDQAIVDHQAGRLTQAEAAYRRIIEACPTHPQACFNLGVLLLQQQGPGAAKPLFAKAARGAPQQPACWQAYLEVLLQLDELDEARRVWLEAHRALGEHECLQALVPRLDPHAKAEADELHRRGRLLREQGYLLEAELCWRQAMRLQPKMVDSWQELCAAVTRLSSAVELVESGGLAAAQTQLRELLQQEYSWLGHSALLFCLLHDAAAPVADVVAEHRRFGLHAERLWAASIPKHTNVRDPERVLRIGFVSGDLRKHPVATFLEPVLQHLQDRALRLYAYSNYPGEDEVSARLRGRFVVWRNIHALDDAAAAQLIDSDGIDILIDLSGHTSYNRLPLFARKPAPVQASWIGYPGTTGLGAVDYYFLLGDQSRYSPLQEQFVEQLVALPAVVPFQALSDAPPANRLPALLRGHLTLASFNRIGKVNDESLALWGAVMAALPDARLLLGDVSPTDTETVLARCRRQGIDERRVTLLPRVGLQDYLRLHHEVDLLLDTFPYSGGSTTLYGLWMGVPTLTLAGPTLASRQGMANLRSVGLDAFVASDRADYIGKVVSWAARLEELDGIRAVVRPRLAGQRPGQVLADGLYTALRSIWRRWCRGEPAEPLSVDG